MNYIIITKDNIEDFEGLLPTDMVSGGERVSMGAYDDEGFVQGAVSYRFREYEYSVDWIFVDPLARRQGVGSGQVNEKCGNYCRDRIVT